MNLKYLIYTAIVCIVVVITTSTFFKQKLFMIPKTFSIISISDLVHLFPNTVQLIKTQNQKASERIVQVINEIIKVPHTQRTFSNTVLPLDHLVSSARVFFNVHEILEMVSPEESIRQASHESTIHFKNLWIDQVSNNELLYKAVKAYAQDQALSEELTQEQWYVLNELIDNWERNGLNLLPEQQLEVTKIKKELAVLTTDFDRNIATDKTTIIYTREELKGLPEDFFASLQTTPEGSYSLTLDYPTYNAVMERCSVAASRKKMYQAFVNRAYPVNAYLLQEIIKKRAALAQMLGFSSYAELDLANQMVKSPERADQFLQSLREKAMPKAQRELALLIQNLPDSVVLNDEGQMYPWDGSYARYAYKEKYFNIDEFKIAEYFPMEHTVERLLDIYRAFFGLDIIVLKDVLRLWHSDVQVLQVNDSTTKQFLGYLLLDLYPRPNKYSHACMAPIVPATYNEHGKANGAVALVIANFSKPTESRPSLLQRKEVETFFHEFGHAIHELLGRTQLALVSGTQVKTDFVELPSQMLEEWMTDHAILKMVSKHYITGEPLPDEIIKKIIELKHFSTGAWIMAQLLYSDISLQFFKKEKIDCDAVLKHLKTLNTPYVAYDSNDHFYANFGHLTGYGAKYYGYLWSKVFALDIFEQIKQAGLLNAAMGKKYVGTILSKGGSTDPNELLYAFLGRLPSEDVFIREMGL